MSLGKQGLCLVLWLGLEPLWLPFAEKQCGDPLLWSSGAEVCSGWP